MRGSQCRDDDDVEEDVIIIRYQILIHSRSIPCLVPAPPQEVIIKRYQIFIHSGSIPCTVPAPPNGNTHDGILVII